MRKLLITGWQCRYTDGVKILYLAESPSTFLEELKTHAKVSWKSEALKLPLDAYDYLICYGYRHIIKPDVLRAFPGRAINLHISYLPWNRGADPNFWSFFEGTPKGVTIHHIDEGLDTGDIVAQKEVSFTSQDTLETSYNTLQQEIQKLFWNTVWPAMKANSLPRKSQNGNGSNHRAKDLSAHWDLISSLGWKTPVSVIEQAGRLQKKD